MPSPKGTPAILVRLTAAERDHANAEAEARGVSVNELIRLLLRRARRERLTAKGEPIVEIEIAE